MAYIRILICISTLRNNVRNKDNKILRNRPLPSSPGPLFQNEGRCSAFDMEIIFHSHANKTHFQKKGCAPSFILKVRVFGTRKWPIKMCAVTKVANAFGLVTATLS